MQVSYPPQAIPLEVHIIIFIVSTLIVLMAIIFLRKYAKVQLYDSVIKELDNKLPDSDKRLKS